MTCGVKGVDSLICEDRSWNYLDLSAGGVLNNCGSADIPDSTDPVGTASCCNVNLFCDLEEIVADLIVALELKDLIVVRCENAGNGPCGAEKHGNTAVKKHLTCCEVLNEVELTEIIGIKLVSAEPYYAHIVLDGGIEKKRACNVCDSADSEHVNDLIGILNDVDDRSCCRAVNNAAGKLDGGAASLVYGVV